MKKIYVLLCAVLACSVTKAQVIPTADMETWRSTTAGSSTVEAPVSWYGSDSTIIALGESPTIALILGTSNSDWRRQIFKESTIIHGGSFSAKIMTRLEDTFRAPGVLTNAIPSVQISFSPPGISGISLKGGTAIAAKPTSVSAWVQYQAGPSGIDSGTLSVQALGHYNGKDTVIGTGYITIAPTSSSWVQVTANFNYFTDTVAVDTFRIAFSSSNKQSGKDSSTLYVDDLSMTTVPNPVHIDHTGVSMLSGGDVVNVYPNPASGMLYINGPLNSGLSCQLFSMNGQVLTAKTLTGKDAVDISYLPQGLYFYAIYDKSGNAIQRGKVAVNK